MRFIFLVMALVACAPGSVEITTGDYVSPELESLREEVDDLQEMVGVLQEEGAPIFAGNCINQDPMIIEEGVLMLVIPCGPAQSIWLQGFGVDESGLYPTTTDSFWSVSPDGSMWVGERTEVHFQLLVQYEDALLCIPYDCSADDWEVLSSPLQ